MCCRCSFTCSRYRTGDRRSERKSEKERARERASDAAKRTETETEKERENRGEGWAGGERETSRTRICLARERGTHGSSVCVGGVGGGNLAEEKAFFD